VYFLLKGYGIKEERQEEIIQIGENYTSVDGEFVSDEETKSFRIFIQKSHIIQKSFHINSVRKRFFEYTQETLPVVIFTPKLVQIIDGEPSTRRKYIDGVLGKFDIEYKKRLTNYEKALTKRNKILERVHDVDRLREELIFWDSYLIEQANYIVEKRREYVTFLNTGTQIEEHTFSIKYTENTISEKTLEETFEKQYILKSTRVGPQRDDYQLFQIKSGENETKNVHSFGSRSEHRLALFWLIVNELRLFQEKMNLRPLLLLDDIFSELDIKNRAHVIELIKKYQTILSTTETEIIELIDIPHAVINLP
jgi:DNA replication and repair protein RecF